MNSIILVLLAVPRKFLGQNHFESALGGLSQAEEGLQQAASVCVGGLLQRGAAVTCMSHSPHVPQHSLSPHAPILALSHLKDSSCDVNAKGPAWCVCVGVGNEVRKGKLGKAELGARMARRGPYKEILAPWAKAL